jgi:hypothetical protein
MRSEHIAVTPNCSMTRVPQTDLEADRQVANTLAELIIGGSLASTALGAEDDGRHLGETA